MIECDRIIVISMNIYIVTKIKHTYNRRIIHMANRKYLIKVKKDNTLYYLKWNETLQRYTAVRDWRKALKMTYDFAMELIDNLKVDGIKELVIL
jgi:hypothetical protein